MEPPSPSLFYTLLLLFLSLSFFSPATGHSVAIVGGGIGGAACAYFLHLFAPEVVVDVYEKESIVGGRLKHVTFGGEVCEVGGDAWSTVCFLASFSTHIYPFSILHLQSSLFFCPFPSI